MALKLKFGVYQKSIDSPGIYEFRSDQVDAIREFDDWLWNEDAVQKLEDMYERLAIPQGLRW